MKPPNMEAIYWTLAVFACFFLGMFLGALWERFAYYDSRKPTRLPLGCLCIVLTIAVTILLIRL